MMLLCILCGEYYINFTGCARFNCKLYARRAIDIMFRVFANGPGDQGSIPGQVIPKTQKMVFDAALHNTHPG